MYEYLHRKQPTSALKSLSRFKNNEQLIKPLPTGLSLSCVPQDAGINREHKLEKIEGENPIPDKQSA